MNWKAVISVLGYLLIIMAPCLMAPLAVSLIYDLDDPRGSREVIAFITTSVLSLGLGLSSRHKFNAEARDVGRREGFVIVTAGWLLASVVGMLPFLIGGAIEGITDAFFETMSGFTTTGASILTANEIDGMLRGLMFWRCMTQWLGGMGIVVLSVALLSFLGVGGYRLLKAEAPGGVAYERARPRITDAAKDLWKLYLGMSVVLVFALMLAGTTPFDALCHTFTTMSTGGFSPHGESIAFFGAPVQWILIAFMFMAGVNFSLHAHLLRGQIGPMLRNPEFRTYVAILLGCSAVGILVTPTGAGMEERLREILFQVVSIGTTTGFATENYDTWPSLVRLLLLLLMIVGGCMGSTGGGMKHARLVIYAKALVRQLHLLIYPHAVRPIRTGDRVVDPTIVSNILAFGTLYAFSLVVGALLMATCGYDLETSISAAAAALGNIGPGLAEVGPAENWSHLPAAAKWVMAFLMLAGRLELFSLVVLLTPAAWKR